MTAQLWNLKHLFSEIVHPCGFSVDCGAIFGNTPAPGFDAERVSQ